MKYTSPVRRAMIVVGALAIAGAPTAVADPSPSTATDSTTAETSTTTATTTTAAPTTSASIPPVTRTPSADPEAPTSTRPVPTTTAPATTTPPATPSGATSTASTAVTGPGELRVDTGAFTVTGPVQAGDVVPGTMDVTVTDTRRDGVGWTADVKATAMHGTQGNTFSPGPDSYYRAQNTPCSESAGRVRLREDAVIVATAPAACTAATWTAAVGIAVPADVAPDTYSLTITHSVY